MNNFKKLNQKGFGAIEALLILIIVAGLGFVGWYVMNSNKQKKGQVSNIDKSAVQTTPSTKSNDQKYIFREMGVKIDLPDALSGLTYAVSNSDGVQYLALTNPEFNNSLQGCNPGEDLRGASFATVDKRSGIYPKNPDVLNNDGSLLKQFNGYYIEAGIPNGLGCSDQSKADSFSQVNSKVKNALFDAFKTVEEVK
jgi:hypothetical protein